MSLALLLLHFSCKNSIGNSAKHQPSAFDLEDEVRQVFEKHGLMGMSLILVKNNQLMDHITLGLADHVRQIPITERTTYRIASISKTLTAIALMQLWDKGLVDLNRDVSEYLGWSLVHPKFPDSLITLNFLLSHQSSIIDADSYSSFSQDMIRDKLHIKELFHPNGKYYNESTFHESAPGSYFKYTNCTWGIIASIIEIVSGQKFDDYCRDHIFRVLDMTSDFNVAKLDHIENLAVLYRYRDYQWIAQVDDYTERDPRDRAWDGYELGSNGLLYGPQGGLRASALDLQKLMGFFMTRKGSKSTTLLSPEAVQMMMQPAWAFDGNNGDTWEEFFMSYGLGIHIITNTDSADIILPNLDMSGHPGIAYGLLSDMYFDKQSGTGIIFITNGSKLPFEYGESTSFYQVEEDIFKAIRPFME